MPGEGEPTFCGIVHWISFLSARAVVMRSKTEAMKTNLLSVPGFSRFILLIDQKQRSRNTAALEVLKYRSLLFRSVSPCIIKQFHPHSKTSLQKWIKYSPSMEEVNNICPLLPFNGNIMLPAPLKWLSTVAIYLMNQLDT
ncbi:hypothetical protein AVEN_157057-1 [Araneus ventricosus]|uniref:Uncharacterized protein n=1 Tax=Araneus ventricosus TaxID=182803 RepID=A0A4Y2TCG9_ARAVE|nr:hypothetical protein AVEN_160017-1 [Araneus ventricosus]GBN97129.1 hypothetical protein AVEN_199396-1 [Araneus ventricosus]GBN97775.1 hypothetical protein AVEN_229855-1 [Araneus ventricosus]GBN97810.1 hypothetical protein AVEN_157057-1 [Araneus ventricosus]